MLDYLSKNGVDIGAVIELGLEKIKLEKLVKDMEKQQQNEVKKEEENRQNEEANNTVTNEENDTVKNNTTTFNGGENR